MISGQSENDINQRNINFQRETNVLNEKLWREKFDYDKWQYLNTLQYNSEEARKAFMREAQFNSPFNQVQMLRAAGINPFSVFGKNGNVATASSSPASGSPVSSTAPPAMIAPQMSLQNSGLNSSLMLVSTVADVIDKLSSSKLKGSQSKEIESLLTHKIANLIAQTDNEAAAAQLKRFEQEINETYGFAMADARLQGAFADLEETIANTAESIARGDLIDVQQETEKAQAALFRMEKKVKGEERIHLQYVNKTFMSKYNKEMEEANSRIAENKASAERAHEEAVMSRSIRPYAVSEASWHAVNAKADALKNTSTIPSFVSESKWRSLSERNRSLLIAAEIAYKNKEIDWYEFNQIIGSLLEGTSQVVSVKNGKPVSSSTSTTTTMYNRSGKRIGSTTTTRNERRRR